MPHCIFDEKCLTKLNVFLSNQMQKYKDDLFVRKLNRPATKAQLTKLKLTAKQIQNALKHKHSVQHIKSASCMY